MATPAELIAKIESLQQNQSRLEEEIKYLSQDITPAMQKELNRLSNELSKMTIAWSINLVFLAFLIYKVYDIAKG